MPAQPTVPRQSRPVSVASDDAFAVRAMEFADWARANIRLIIGGAIVAAILVGGLLFYRIDRDRREERAASAFVRLQQTVSSGNNALATRDLERYVRQYGSTTYGQEARIALAQLHLQQNQPAKAVEALGGVADEVEDSPVGPQAALLLAAAQQAAGQRDAAIQTYLRVADEAPLKLHRAEALENAAILRAEAGNAPGSAELYRRLVGEYEEGSFERQLFEMRLSEAEAQAVR